MQNYRDREGKNSRLRYHFQQVNLNEKPSSYRTSYDHNGTLLLYIGEKNILLAPGDYSYTIQYHVDQAVSFLKNLDEFYWNITGNNWDFPIAHVDIDIILPPGININNWLVFTGLAGEQGSDYTAQLVAPNEIQIETTRKLARHAGVTVAIDWPKGYIIEKNFFQKLLQGGDLIGVEIFLFLLIYYTAVYYWESREPPSGSVIPLFTPPASLTPAAMRYISKMEFDDKTFTTAIISIATKGYVRITQAGSTYSVIQTSSDLSTLSPEEVELVKYLFKDYPEVKLDSTNRKAILAAKKALKNSLKKECQKIYFNTHAVYVIPATLLSILGIIEIGSQVMSNIGELLVLLNFTVLFWACSLRFYQQIHFRDFAHVLSVVILIPILIYAILPYLRNFTVAELTIYLSLVAINTVFFHLLRAHTADGRKLMDQIEGFKMYLSITETDRYNKLNPPEKTPALFEKYFPYALALDVENEWSLKLSAVLSQATFAGQTYHPVWYVGNGWNSSNNTAFGSNLNSGLTSAVSTSTGGGYSGGGGGGGGGGGW